jgi:hypothetical protein
MVSTASTPADGSSGSDPSSGGDGGSGTDGSASGLLGSDPASSTYAQFLPDVLTSAIMSGGGTGMALQLAKALDPSIGTKR